MRLSRFSDYALRVCLYLAANDGRVVPISEIVRAHDLSHSNLLKVVNKLVDGGFLNSTRGRRGGVQLANGAEATRVGQVVSHMEGDTQLVDCQNCVINKACGLTRVLVDAKRGFYAALDNYSLHDALMADPRTLGLLSAERQTDAA